MDQEGFDTLLELVRPKIEKQDTIMRKAIPASSMCTVNRVRQYASFNISINLPRLLTIHIIMLLNNQYSFQYGSVNIIEAHIDNNIDRVGATLQIFRVIFQKFASMTDSPNSLIDVVLMTYKLYMYNVKT